MYVSKFDLNCSNVRVVSSGSSPINSSSILLFSSNGKRDSIALTVLPSNLLSALSYHSSSPFHFLNNAILKKSPTSLVLSII